MSAKPKAAPEKWRVVLWDTETPRSGTDRELFRREYVKQATVNRALPGLWRAYPAARLAVVTQFRFTGLFWIAGPEGTVKVPRPEPVAR